MMRKRINPVFAFSFLTTFFLLLLLPSALKSLSKTEIKDETKVLKTEIEKTVTKPDIIDKYLADMTIEEKVGQLFFSRVPKDHQLEDLTNYHLGGYILFGDDFAGQTLESIKALTDSYQASSKIPLLIGSDEEGGTVTRISQILETPLQSPMALYQSGGLETIATEVKQKAELLRSVGIHTSLSPVADQAKNPESFIYPRTIGAGIKETSDYVSTAVKSMKENNLGSTLKHFPGYGDNGDSHIDIIYDNRDLDSLKKSDFLPFKAGIEAGADSVLVSHNIVTSIDSVPASISPKVINLLREDLDFDGVVMTDDFDMVGLANFVSQEEAAFQSIMAGNDFVMGSSYASQIPYLLEKVEQGELSVERIDQSIRRILIWKKNLGILKEPE